MIKINTRGVYIVSADAKDIFLSNYSGPLGGEYSIRYNRGDHLGEINTRRFINSLDYSLDLIKLREVYEKVYRRTDFSFVKRKKEYCRHVINVTFKYSVKEYNQYPDDVYIKFGYLPGDVELLDGVCIRDDELIAIQLNHQVENPIPEELLGKRFVFENGAYRLGKPMRVLYSVSQLREILYRDGFLCDGLLFCRFKRSSGSSRVGKCLFIDEKLYGRMHKWEMCGLKIRDGQETDLAALEAYIALTLSSIIGTVRIRPEHFLVIDDYKSICRERVIATSVGDDGWLHSAPTDAEVENSIWDGQSLIDLSLMGEFKQYGMILLRNRFFKSACFNCNLQQFFRDRGITQVSQLNGFTIAKSIDEIKIITTPSSIKYMKFGPLVQWLNMMSDWDLFGVVKHEKPTSFFSGRMVQVHYQLLNTLQMDQETVDLLVKPSLDYLRMIQTDPAALRHYIRFGGGDTPVTTATTTSDVVYQMLGVTDRFSQTKLYRDFLDDVSRSFKKSLRRGHILVNGNYSTLLGNPMEMLMASIGEFQGESRIGVGNVHSTRFRRNQTILGSRSPHVTMGNIWLAKNRESQEIDRYFNLTDEIVCVNSIGENLLMRLSGADFDSDTVLLTDNPILIGAAEKNYHRFPVPTSMVEARKVVRRYTYYDQADLDIRTSVNKIGEIVNLSQELNTRLWDAVNSGMAFSDVEDLYCDIAKLDVLSGIEIDKAKKEFSVSSVREIKRLKKKYARRNGDGRQIKPNFFGKIDRLKGYYDSSRKDYVFHKTTMDYLQRSVNAYRVEAVHRDPLPFAELLVNVGEYYSRSVKYPQVDRILAMVRDMRKQIQSVWQSANDEVHNASKSRIVGEIREEYQQRVKSIHLNRHTAYRLLLAIDDPENKDISRTLFYLLFSLPNQSFLDLIEESKTPIALLEEDKTGSGSIEIHGFRYRKTFKVPVGIAI